MPTDNFTGAQGVELTVYSGDWVQNRGTLSIWDNAVRGNSGSHQLYHWGADPFPANQYSQVELFVLGSTNRWIGPVCRASLTAGVETGYLLDTSLNGNTFLLVYDAGTPTTLANVSDGARTAGDILRLEVSGGVLTPMINGVIAAMGAIPNLVLASGAAGIGGYGSTSANLQDNWEGGSLSGGNVDVTVVLSSVSAAGNPGNLSVSGAAVTSMPGAASLGDAGGLFVAGAAAVSVPGISAVGSAGSLSIAGSVVVNVADVESGGNVGSLFISTDAAVTLAGVSVTGQAGDIATLAGVVAPVSGVGATGQAGDATVLLAGNVAVQMAGASAVGQVGLLTTSLSSSVIIPVFGVSADGEAGTVTATVSRLVTIAGVNALGQTQNMTISAGSTVLVNGVVSVTGVGIISVPSLSVMAYLEAVITITPALDGVITIKP